MAGQLAGYPTNWATGGFLPSPQQQSMYNMYYGQLSQANPSNYSLQNGQWTLNPGAPNVVQMPTLSADPGPASDTPVYGQPIFQGLNTGQGTATQQVAGPAAGGVPGIVQGPTNTLPGSPAVPATPLGGGINNNGKWVNVNGVMMQLGSSYGGGYGPYAMPGSIPSSQLATSVTTPTLLPGQSTYGGPINAAQIQQAIANNNPLLGNPNTAAYGNSLNSYYNQLLGWQPGQTAPTPPGGSIGGTTAPASMTAAPTNQPTSGAGTLTSQQQQLEQQAQAAFWQQMLYPGTAVAGQPSGGTAAPAAAPTAAPGATVSSPDQALASIAQTGGAPTSAVSEWQAMIAAQQQQIQAGANQMLAMYGASGNAPGSTGFNTANQMYWNQAAANQNALLGQLQLPILQQQLAQQYGATGQLSSQAYQAQMLQMQQALTAASGLSNMYGQGSLSAAGQLAAGGAAGAQGLSSNQMSAAYQQMQAALALQQLGIYGGLNSLQVGQGLGSQQYGVLQSQINNAYQEFLRTQPEYSPLLGLQASASVAYPPMMMQAFAPSALSQIMSGGTNFLNMIQNLFSILGQH